MEFLIACKSTIVKVMKQYDLISINHFMDQLKLILDNPMYAFV